MSFKTELPEFYEEIRTLMMRLNRQDLVSQLPGLSIAWRCPCTNRGCASFTVSGSSTPDLFEMPGMKRPAYTPSLNLNADRGTITVMVDQLGRINGFEVLKRPDVRRKLLGR